MNNLDWYQIYWSGVYVSIVFCVLESLPFFLSVPLKLFSQYKKNFEQIGYRISWVTGLPVPREPGESQLLPIIGAPFAWAFEIGISCALSWIGVLYNIYKVLIVMRGYLARWTAPKDFKDAIWRLKHQPLSKSEVIEQLGILKKCNGKELIELTACIEELLSELSSLAPAEKSAC